MQIGEVAERTALTVDAIRFYEKRNLLPKAVRSTGRFRLYTEGRHRANSLHPANARAGLLAAGSWGIDRASCA